MDRTFVVAGALVVVGAAIACSTFEAGNADGADAGADSSAGDAGTLGQGLVAAWLFDEGAGDVAHDHVGTNDGKLVYHPEWTKGHDGGAALLFHGPDDAGNGDYVRVVSSAALNNAISRKTMTIALWLNSTAPGGEPRVFAWRNSVHLKLNGGQRLELELDGRDGPFWTETSNVSNKWHHLAATFADGEVAIYEDGVKDVIADHDGSASTLPNGDDILIGVGSDEGDFATGTIERVFLSNRALTADEIKQAMAL